MGKNSTPIGWLNILFIICLSLPVLVLLMMPGNTMMGGFLWLPIVLLLCFWMIASMTAASRAEQREETDHTIDDGVSMILDGEQPEAIRAVMNVRVATRQHGARIFRGRLTALAEEALTRLQADLGQDCCSSPCSSTSSPDEEHRRSTTSPPSAPAVVGSAMQPSLSWRSS